MKKNKKTKKNLSKNNAKLFGLGAFVIGISLIYSIVYIVKNETNNFGIGSSVFKESSTYLGDHCVGVCNQVATNPGDIVVRYNGDLMTSGAGDVGGHHFPKMKDESVDIPAGEYTVMLESFDSYVGRGDAPSSEQSHEQYYVVLKSDGDEVARTGTTDDLEDGIEEDANITFTNNANNTISFNDAVDEITIVHAGPSNAVLQHGLEPICMLLERIDVDPVCGDDIVNQSSEQCDDGNTTSGDGCSSTCQNEVDPVCGDDIVNQSSEQCDDGNTTSGDGCSSTCQNEVAEEEEEEEEEEEDCESSIGNYIWYDTNSNGVQEDIEEGIPGIKVCAFNGNRKYCDTTDKNGRYKIKDLCEGSYDVRVNGVGGMLQTYDPDGKKDNKTEVKLKNNDKHTKADFGYRGAAPATGLATNIALLIGFSTLITLGILIIMKKKGAL